MSELKEKFKSLLQELNENLRAKEDLEFVQKKFYELLEKYYPNYRYYSSKLGNTSY